MTEDKGSRTKDRRQRAKDSLKLRPPSFVLCPTILCPLSFVLCPTHISHSSQRMAAVADERLVGDPAGRRQLLRHGAPDSARRPRYHCAAIHSFSLQSNHMNRIAAARSADGQAPEACNARPVCTAGLATASPPVKTAKLARGTAQQFLQPPPFFRSVKKTNHKLRP